MALVAQGYWISPTGGFFRTDSHILFMQAQPNMFHLTAKQAGSIRTGGPDDRERLIQRAEKLGWIRVMGGFPTYYYEVAEFTPSVLERLLAFTGDAKIPADTMMTISESGVPLSIRPEIHFPVSELTSARVQMWLRNPPNKRKAK